MNSHERRTRRFGVALMLLGVLVIVSLAGLRWETALFGLTPLGREHLTFAATVTGGTMLFVVVVAWLADLWSVRAQRRELSRATAELSGLHRELTAARERHEFQLTLKCQELEGEQTLSDERAKLHRLEQVLERRRSDERRGAETEHPGANHD